MLLARQEGISGMFKGLSLNLIKNPMGTAVSAHHLLCCLCVRARREIAPAARRCRLW